MRRRIQLLSLLAYLVVVGGLYLYGIPTIYLFFTTIWFTSVPILRGNTELLKDPTCLDWVCEGGLMTVNFVGAVTSLLFSVSTIMDLFQDLAGLEGLALVSTAILWTSILKYKWIPDEKPQED